MDDLLILEEHRSARTRAHATFYGGADASGTMGGACGYGNLYSTGYGTHTAALSTVMFNDGAACGQCYKVACDRELADPQWCKPGVTVTITATNLCPPNHALPSDNGGWCNQPRPHFDMAQPAWEKIGVYKGGIIPVEGKPNHFRVPCEKRGGVRFKINGHNYFNLVPVFNVATSGSIKSMDVKTSDSNDWAPMARNWGANWQSLANLTGKMLSFRLTDTEGQTLVLHNIVLSGWKFGQTFTSSLQFK
ncbi:expansin-A14-like [Triticum urartu]|nr:expansin-A14-like [Triticum urartu]